jgi:hypothetical protein
MRARSCALTGWPRYADQSAAMRLCTARASPCSRLRSPRRCWLLDGRPPLPRSSSASKPLDYWVIRRVNEAITKCDLQNFGK